MVQEETFDDDALDDQVERVDCDWPPAHVRIDNEDPMLAERAGYHGAALARNSVDGKRHATVSDCCPDLVERAVFIHDHEITADGLQFGDELRATHEIDRLNAPRFGDGDERPADTRIGRVLDDPVARLEIGRLVEE